MIYLLSRFKRKDFLHKLMTGDEKWVLYDNSKRCKSWFHPGEPASSTLKLNIHVKKLLLCIWWDWQCVLLRVTWTRSEGQCWTLQATTNQCEWCTRAKRSFTGSETRQVLLLHDNARPHTAKATLEIISNLGWELLPHAAYSPDFAPSDYHLFRSLQHHLADSHFQTLEEVRKSIHDFIKSKPSSFFRNWIRELPERWQKCIESEEDYF